MVDFLRDRSVVEDNAVLGEAGHVRLDRYESAHDSVREVIVDRGVLAKLMMYLHDNAFFLDASASQSNYYSSRKSCPVKTRKSILNQCL